MLYLESEIKQSLMDDSDYFSQIMALKGKSFRQLENRHTQKIMLNDNYYFIKQHFGVGWKEIFKNLFQLRLPIVSAQNEWQAIKYLTTLNVATQTVVGFGCQGINPASIKSFLITSELPAHITLEDLCKDWKYTPPVFSIKINLIKEVAKIAHTLHSNGVNHRDFYLCHFLLSTHTIDNKLYLIDLHRAQIRKHVPKRWLIKDLAGLYFSSRDIGLTKRDLLRFIKEYRNKSLRELHSKELMFWQKVKKRGDKLYQQHAK